MDVVETVKVVCWTVVALAAINGLTVYAVVHFLMTGRGVMPRRNLAAPVAFDAGRRE